MGQPLMSSQGLQSQAQLRFLRARRPDVAAAWTAGRTLGGRRFQPRALDSLPIRKQRPKRRRRRA